jgi:hypothetical protein
MPVEGGGARAGRPRLACGDELDRVEASSGTDELLMMLGAATSLVKSSPMVTSVGGRWS